VALALALAGCGSDEEPPRPTATGTPRPAEGPATIDRRAAVAEARSAASQDAVRQDYSIPPPSFRSACRARDGAARSRAWTCSVRSGDGRCRGDVDLVVTRTGAVTTSRIRLRCTGSSRRG
jgi:hypothetical protein